jgi:DNA-binding transcriptional regulator YiaG
LVVRHARGNGNARSHAFVIASVSRANPRGTRNAMAQALEATQTMGCWKCAEPTTSRVKHILRRTFAKSTFSAEVDVDACARCGEVLVPATALLAFERAVAIDLARRGPVDGQTFRWIRRHTGISVAELSAAIGRSLETIGSWEEGRRHVVRSAWLVLTTLALELLEAPSGLHERIVALATPHIGQRAVELEDRPSPLPPTSSVRGRTLFLDG